jgi:hypothetical protein
MPGKPNPYFMAGPIPPVKWLRTIYPENPDVMALTA